MRTYTMEELVSILNEASDAYYNGREIMTNLEFDSLFDQLKEMESVEGRILPNSPTVNVGAPVVDYLPKFTHTYLAKSLDKTKSIDEMKSKFRKEISNYGELYDNPHVVVMFKEDGSTAQAYYDKGRLQNLVTRGDGEVGSVVTHNARYIAGLPVTIKYSGHLVVRGEVLMSYDDFERINEPLPEDDKFMNPRNLASASLTLLDSNETKDRHLQFKAFNLVHADEDDNSSFEDIKKSMLSSFKKRLDILSTLGFDVVEYDTGHLDELDAMITHMTEQVPEYPYPVDGLVVAYDNYALTSTLRGTQHHPHILSGYAFKWEDKPVETVLREIEWSPSRTGLLNPVAIFDPVPLYGTTVKRASIHNVSILNDLNLHIGDRIEVTKSNMIIPYIVSNLDKDKHSKYTINELRELVGICPTCGHGAAINRSAGGILTAFCPNSRCPEKMIGKLAHFCGRDCMDIQGMSEETIKKLVEHKFITEYSDFFELDQKPGISFLPGFGKRSWSKMCEAAEKAKTTTFVKFLTALSIPNIGTGQAKVLKRYLTENYESLCNLSGTDSSNFNLPVLLSNLGDVRFNFSQIDGFGDIMSSALLQWLADNFNINSDYVTPEINVLKYLTFEDKPASPTLNAESSISGKSFCITGKLVTFKNRKELVAKIEELGGKWVDSVSGKTDYLINNDVTSTSGKNKKAKDLNIPIISEEDFLNMIS